MVVLHGPKTVDKLAVDLADKEQIILVLSLLPQKTNFKEIFKTINI